jgi:hypothetical protein
VSLENNKPATGLYLNSHPATKGNTYKNYYFYVGNANNNISFNNKGKLSLTAQDVDITSSAFELNAWNNNNSKGIY